MESESGTTNTKVSDSGYSNSCSNTNSQRSASSKSHSGSNSSRSSGYCGGPQPDGSVDTTTQATKYKKKKPKSSTNLSTLVAPPNPSTLIEPKTSVVLPKETLADQIMGLEALSTVPVETAAVAVESIEKTAELNFTAPLNITITAETLVSAEEDLTTWLEELQNDQQMPIETSLETIIIEPEEEPKEKIEEPPTSQPDDGFCCVVSMFDGVVLYTTPSLTPVLGFPKDMFLGKSFIDFVHPKDRETFSRQITSGLPLPIVDSQGKYKDTKHCLYVCLKKYKGLKPTGFEVVEKAITYQAFKLTVSFRHMTDKPSTNCLDNRDMLLVVVAVPIYSTYKVPEEMTNSAKFGMRHNAACIFSHVDPDVVTHFGFLPQDMIGKSVFDFYHPEDMQFLKEIYETVMRMCQIAGSVFRSKPYRFAVQNGGFAMIETEWSSMVNPWSKKLEVVIGLHRVLKGPQNPNIFEVSKENEYLPEKVLNESKLIQGEILLLLNDELARPSEIVKLDVNKRCKELASFIETLMDEVKTNLHIDLQPEIYPTISVSPEKMEHGSVELGVISPHHDYSDSKSSSETPPSYNQLNYNENIERFFQSKPKTTPSSDESNGVSQNSTDIDQEGKSSSNAQNCNNTQKCSSPLQNSSDSGSGSAGNLSSGSNQNMESGTTSGTNTSTNDSYKPLKLTEALLLKHNEDMKKIMIKRHKQHRSNFKEHKKVYHKLDYNVNKTRNAREETLNYTHGIKRSIPRSWEGDNHKVSKHKHTSEVQKSTNNCQPKITNIQNQATTSPNRINGTSNMYLPGINDVNMWPPFSLSVSPINNSQPANVTAAQPGNPPGLMPFYYIPRTNEYVNNGLAVTKYQVQYMPSMFYNYNTMIPASQILCSPLPVFPVTIAPNITPMSYVTRPCNVPVSNGETIVSVPMEQVHKPSPPSVANTPVFQRPASQATSVKAEPGSIMGSIASASVANKAFSECSRNNLGVQSVCSPYSPIVSPPYGETEMERFNLKKINEMSDKNKHEYRQNKRENNKLDDESSCSSSYSSFLKTDSASGSNESNIMENQIGRTKSDHSWKSRKSYPSRKKEPPWLETVSVTPDLIYRYQMTVKGIEDILQEDLNSLRAINQPVMVNDQLNQLYIEMDLDGLSRKLTLEEGIISSSGSSEENGTNSNLLKKRKSINTSIFYEENAPFPSPD